MAVSIKNIFFILLIFQLTIYLKCDINIGSENSRRRILVNISSTNSVSGCITKFRISPHIIFALKVKRFRPTNATDNCFINELASENALWEMYRKVILPGFSRNLRYLYKCCPTLFQVLAQKSLLPFLITILVIGNIFASSIIINELGIIKRLTVGLC